MSFTTTLSYNDQTVLLVPGKMTFFDELYVDYKIETKNNWTRIQMMIHPKQEIVINKLKLEKECRYSSTDRIFCNGFQSSSESREFELGEKIPKLKPFLKSKSLYTGDTYLDFINRKKGHFHSWTYGYIRKRDKIDFVGSLNERTAFTSIQYDTKNGTIGIEKECAGLMMEHSFPILDIFIAIGKESWVFKEYFNAMKLPSLKEPSLIGWSTKKNSPKNLSEEFVLKNVSIIEKEELKIDLIQIDAGYQKHVGDWLQIKNTFPSGMQKVAHQIRTKGFKAGIWLAPFICETASDIYKTKQHWLLKDKNGNPIKVGHSPDWGGWFYAMDFYHKEVQDYLLSVFKIILEKWGYDLVKLDMLYTACIQPPPNKTRGQMMSDLIDFLHRTIGKQRILASAVPLGSTFGMVNYVQTGTETGLRWEDKIQKFLGNRERTSTISALRSTLGRWHLNSRAFQNTSGIIILRDRMLKLNPTQQYSVLIIYTLLGKLIFFSGSVEQYSEEQWIEFSNIHHWKDSQMKNVEQLSPDIYLIRFSNNGKNWICVCNLTNREQKVTVGKSKVELLAFESLILADKK